MGRSICLTVDRKPGSLGLPLPWGSALLRLSFGSTTVTLGLGSPSALLRLNDRYLGARLSFGSPSAQRPLPWGSALLRLSFGSTDTSTVPWGLENFSKSTSLCFGALGLKGLALKPVTVSRRTASCLACTVLGPDGRSV